MTCPQCHQGLAWRPRGVPLHHLGMEEMRVHDWSLSGWQRRDLGGMWGHNPARRCHPTVGTALSPPQQTLTGRDCSRGCHCYPSAERGRGSAGTRDSPTATTQQEPGGLRASLSPNPSSRGTHVPTHQVKVTVVAEVVAQRVLSDIVTLAAHQLPVDLGEECRGKDTCGHRGPWG